MCGQDHGRRIITPHDTAEIASEPRGFLSGIISIEVDEAIQSEDTPNALAGVIAVLDELYDPTVDTIVPFLEALRGQFCAFEKSDGGKR